MTPIEPFPVEDIGVKGDDVEYRDAPEGKVEKWVRVEIIDKSAHELERQLLEQAAALDPALVNIVGQYWSRAHERGTNVFDEIAERQAEIGVIE